MSVTPKVYEFVPGLETPGAIIDGVQRVMISTLGTHHWEVVPGSYTAGTTITLRDKATLNRRLRLVAALTGTPNPTVDCYYSHNAGATETYKCWMSGGTTTYAINNGTYGMGAEVAYVIEIEDAITIATAKGTSGGTALVADALTMSVHAGRIFSSHNKSDSANKVGEEGILAGLMMVYNGSTWCWLSNLTGGGGGVASGAQNAVWTGTQYVPVLISPVNVSAATGEALTHWRDSRPNANNALTLRLLENVGDNQTIERLVPFPVAGPISGANATGHFGYTRYIRARKYGYGDTPPLSSPIDNTTVLESAGDPDNIGWRHNYGWNDASVVENLIHIWCPPGAEVEVPT